MDTTSTRLSSCLCSSVCLVLIGSICPSAIHLFKESRVAEWLANYARDAGADLFSLSFSGTITDLLSDRVNVKVGAEVLTWTKFSRTIFYIYVFLIYYTRSRQPPL